MRYSNKYYYGFSPQIDQIHTLDNLLPRICLHFKLFQILLKSCLQGKHPVVGGRIKKYCNPLFSQIMSTFKNLKFSYVISLKPYFLNVCFAISRFKLMKYIQ